MPDSVAIHIGQPKAASTSLQHALADARGVLARHDIHYPLRDGAVDHIAEVADLQLRWIRPRPDNSRGYSRVANRAVPGSWDELVDRTRALPGHVVVSNEALCDFAPAAARVVVQSLSGGHADKVVVVLVIRPLADLLPSMYAQVARDTVVPAFETWLRATLALHLSGRSREHSWWLYPAPVVDAWRCAGAEVRCVPYAGGSSFGATLAGALDIDSVIPDLHLTHANVSPGAAAVTAWQRHLRRSGLDPTLPQVRRAGLRAWMQSPSTEGLRLADTKLALSGNVRHLVADAFPTSAAHAGDWRNDADVEAARKRLSTRLADTSTMCEPPPDPLLVRRIFDSMQDFNSPRSNVPS